MAKYEVKLIRACLFDLNRENDIADVTHLKSVYLERVQDQYRRMMRIFEDNICKKVMGDETQFVGTKNVKRAAVEIITNKVLKGRRPTAYYSKIIIEDFKQEYKEALGCSNEDELRKVCAKIANRFAEGLTYPKGIICFLQFTFQLTRKNIHNFLGIFNTDYKSDIVHFQTQEILDYLSKVFEDDFKSTIIYPYIKEEVIKKRENKQDDDEPETFLKVDENTLKIHVKSNFDPKIYEVAGTRAPIDIQEKFGKVYDKTKSENKSLKALEEQMKDGLEYADLTISFGEGIQFKINAKLFLNQAKLIVTKYGEGVVIKDGEVKVTLGKRDLFADKMIKKFEPHDFE